MPVGGKLKKSCFAIIGGHPSPPQGPMVAYVPSMSIVWVLGALPPRAPATTATVAGGGGGAVAGRRGAAAGDFSGEFSGGP